MAKIIKVKDLYASLGTLVKNGMGEKDLYLVSDDEGNDYRPMYFGATTDTETVKGIMEVSCSGLCNRNPENIVLLG